MLRTVDELQDCRIGATNGDIGKVVDFYFDDEKWTIRYLVADTAGWLLDRKVLVSPHFLGEVDWKGKRVEVALAKDQVKNSPGIDTDKPVSRQQEAAYYDHYKYSYYWMGPYLWGPAPYPGGVGVSGPPVTATESTEASKPEAGSDDIHLRSTNEVAGYTIEATDGAIGHVEDFIIDDEKWTIRYIVVDTRNWWPGKKVLISPEWIKDVSWTESAVYVDLLREAIKTSPEYDSSAPVSRDYERRLYEHYRRSEYWSGES